VPCDADGEFRGVSVVVFPGNMDAGILKALACREAVSLVLDINTRRVRVTNGIPSLEQGTTSIYAHICL
jgi:hypothetical protein